MLNPAAKWVICTSSVFFYVITEIKQAESFVFPGGFKMIKSNERIMKVINNSTWRANTISRRKNLTRRFLFKTKAIYVWHQQRPFWISLRTAPGGWGTFGGNPNGHTSKSVDSKPILCGDSIKMFWLINRFRRLNILTDWKNSHTSMGNSKVKWVNDLTFMESEL